MELKNAVAVCLIALFSAGLVVLIARSLDLQAASRLEPQLQQIAEELRAIRKSGGMAAAPGDAAAGSVDLQNGLVVYYLHGNMRCPTCRSIESQTDEIVQADFGPELDAGEIAWKVVNYEQPAGQALGKKFEVIQPVVVLAQMKDGQVADWKRLDEVWALVGNKAAFGEYVRGEVAGMLSNGKGPAATPAAPNTGGKATDIPLPREASDIPVT
jgi:hypothetical protein